MRYKYILRIEGAEQKDIARVLGKPSSNESGSWTLEFEEGSNDPPINFVDRFLELLDNKFDFLDSIGVSRDDITIWLLYEYDEQCNLEFSSKDLMRLGEAGIGLCVSCWQAPSSIDC
jgi:hypothetical protein